MTRRLLLLWLVALALSACGTIEPFAARVNATVISEDGLQRELRAMAGNRAYVEALEQQGVQVRGQGPGTFDAGFVAQVLGRQILFELLHQEVLRRRVEPSQADRDEVHDEVIESVGGRDIFSAFPKPYQDDLIRRSAEVNRLQEAVAPVPDDEAVRRFYEQNQAQFRQTCVSHILFAVVGPDGRPDPEGTQAQLDTLRAEADQVKAELAAGADFAALAGAHSRDTGSKARGGDLGCGGPGRFVAEFERAIETVAVGEVAGPVETRFGLHLIKVNDRRVQAFDEAAGEARQALTRDAGEAFNRVIQDAVTNARISVNPRYGRFDKEGQQPGVVPPQPPEVRGAPAFPTISP